MNLSDINGATRANAKFVGTFVGHSYKAGLSAPVLHDDKAHAVRKMAEKRLRDSMAYELFRSSDTEICGLRHTQIELDEAVGKGTFSDVYSIKGFRKLQSGQKLNPQKYVVKILQPKFARQPELLAKHAADLLKDGMLLAALDHKHILKVKGWTPTLLAGIETSGRHDAFSIILEKLNCTMNERIDQWKQKSRKFNFNFLSRGSKKSDLWKERISIAICLADSIKYIHDQRILHRDLKPENVGFDSSDVLKLYDFDVARVMPEASLIDPDATFRLTQNVGSLRYMSPECWLGFEYNRKSDVYSFSHLLYELLSLEKPYTDIKSNEHEHSVFRVGFRPIIPEEWPSILRDLIHSGWSQDARTRPDMHYFYDCLQSYFSEIQKSQAMSPASRGGTFQFKSKDSSTPPSPGQSMGNRQSFSLKMGASTPRLLKGKVLVEQASISKLDL